MYIDVKKLAKALVQLDPELANEIYFALDEEFVKKSDSYENLSEITQNWVESDVKKYGPITIEDPGDGSGDGLLTFPEGLCDSLGWETGDTLKFENSEHGTIVISNITKK